jgi:NDP-sugar pyrophosphorylase family protein
MKAMVLAAGVGSRLAPLTTSVPKPMVEIAGRPLLEHTIQYLRDFDVRSVVMNLHYLPEVIANHFQHGDRWGMKIAYSHEQELLGTAGAVKKVAYLFTERFLVVYGDNLTSCNLRKFEEFHVRAGAAVSVALFKRDDTSQSGVAELDDSGRIRRFVEKPRLGQTDSNWVNAGLLIAEREIFDFIPEGAPVDFGRDVLPALIAAGKPVYGYRMTNNERLWWIDTPMDYQRVCSDFAQERAV